MVEWKARLKQDGSIVARAYAPTREQVEREIRHYAMMYAQDGPVEVEIIPPRRS